MSSMLEFVLSKVPEDWEEVLTYDKSYILFDLHPHTVEYSRIRNLFYGFEIAYIRRVQNPFQYGRFKLRQEMLKNYRNVVRTKYFFAFVTFNGKNY